MFSFLSEDEHENEKRQKYLEERRETFEKTLKENFPTKLVVTYCIGLIAFAITSISIQSLMFKNKYSFYYISSGYWVSLIYLFIIALIFILYVQKSEYWYTWVVISSILGGFISAAGLTFVNLIGLPINQCLFGSPIPFSLASSDSSSSECANNVYLYQSVIMIVLGLFSLFWMISFAVILQCSFGRVMATRNWRRTGICL